jgi:type I restriction enzyme S subunit
MEVKKMKNNVGMSWSQVKIADVLFFQEGPGVRNTQFTNSGVKLLNVGNINNGNLTLEATKIFISEEEAYGKYKHFLVDEGDLLIASSGIVVDNFHNKITWAKKVDLPLCMNTSTIRFKSLDPNILDIKYFSYFLKTKLFSEQLRKLITGSAQLNFGSSHLNQMTLPLPPLATQKRIAEILDAADALRRKDQELLKKYDELAQAIFIDMFGDPVKNEKGWEVKKLGDLSDVGSSVRVFVDELVDDGIPFLRGQEIGAMSNGEKIEPSLFISKEHYDKLNNQGGVPKIGDLLMPSICPDGRIFQVVTNEPFYFKDGRVLWIKTNEKYFESTFLKFLLKEKFLRNYSNIASGSTFAELKIFALKAIELPVPPIALQIQFAKRINNGLVQINSLRFGSELSSSLFQTLLQKAFKGELIA